MEKLEIGKKYIIHSYKHNGKIYKAWDEDILQDYNSKLGVYIFGNDHAQVMEDWSMQEQRNLLLL